MQTMLSMDVWVLERLFTPFAWKIERLTGRTNFFLALLCFGIAGVFASFAVVINPLWFSLSGDCSMASGCLFLSLLACGEHMRGRHTWNVPAWVQMSAGARRLVAIFAAVDVFLMVLEAYAGLPMVYVGLEKNGTLAHRLAYILLTAGLYFIAVRRPPLDVSVKREVVQNRSQQAA